MGTCTKRERGGREVWLGLPEIYRDGLWLAEIRLSKRVLCMPVQSFD